MKRGGPLRRRTPLRPMGRKGARDQADRRNIRRALMARSGGRCEARWSEFCTGVGVHAHHLRRRSAGGTNDLDNLIWVCAFDHQRIHDCPAEALVRGFLKPGWSA